MSDLVDFSDEALQALLRIQDLQDCGVAWGKAYADVFEPTKDFE